MATIAIRRRIADLRIRVGHTDMTGPDVIAFEAAIGLATRSDNAGMTEHAQAACDDAEAILRHHEAAP